MTKKCSIEECNRPHYGQGYCAMHYQRWKRLGDPLAGRTYNERGQGSLINGGYPAIGGKMIHITIAEKALGKPLPSGAHVHHVDEDKTNYSNTNLVICPDAEYHKLIHKRMEALNACGNPNYRKCLFCKQYDDPANMYKHVTSLAHRKCHTEQQNRRYKGNPLGSA